MLTPEYLNGANKQIKELMEDKENALYTNVVTESEIISKVKRKNMDFNLALETIN